MALIGSCFVRLSYCRSLFIGLYFRMEPLHSNLFFFDFCIVCEIGVFNIVDRCVALSVCCYCCNHSVAVWLWLNPQAFHKLMQF